MKKLLIICISFFLFACASGPNANQLASKMPKGSIMMKIPAPSNPISTGMVVGMISASGGTSGKELANLLGKDNLQIGLFGKSQAINKAVAIYGLKNAPTIGKGVGLYILGDSTSDKNDLEKAAQEKNVEMHYFFMAN